MKYQRISSEGAFVLVLKENLTNQIFLESETVQMLEGTLLFASFAQRYIKTGSSNSL